MEKLMINAGETLSHAYIVASASEEEREAMALELAAAMLCEGPYPHPCGRCRHCRKVHQGIHPDMIRVERAVDDKGVRKREIQVAQVRPLVSDAQVMPNEAERKVYVISDADTMNLNAQNALLKLLEEPPGGACFLLCAAAPDQLLPTVRSRCVLLRRNGEAAEDGESARRAAEFLAVVASGDRVKLLRWCVGSEQLDGRAAEAFVRACREALADILCLRSQIRLSPRRCAELDTLLEKCAAMLRLNTGVKHVFGLLAVDAISDDK
jgi:DNA polymerase-3 subunit delta'